MPPRYTNTVPQGAIGTGNAGVFTNPVAAQFGNQLARLRENEYEDQLRAEQLAEKVAERMRANRLAISEGKLYASEIGKMEQDFINEGVALQQSGINPWGSHPKALSYQAKEAQVKARQGFRKALEAEENDYQKYIRDNYTKLDPQDIVNRSEFFSKNTLEDLYKGNLRPPTVHERFNMASAVKGVNPVTMQNIGSDGKVITDELFLNKPATKELFVSTVAAAPGGEKVIAEASSGLPASEVEQLSADPSQNEAAIKKLYADNKPLRDELAADGILYDTPDYDTFVTKLARSQASMKRKWDNFTEQGVASISGGLKEHKKVADIPANPTWAQLDASKRGWANIALAKDRVEKEDAGGTATDVRRAWIADIKNFEPNALERLVAAGNARSDYDKSEIYGGFKILQDPKTKQYIFRIPKKIKRDEDGAETTVIPARSVVIDHNDPNFEAFWNQIIGDISEGRVDLGSIGAKSANLKKSPPSSPVTSAPQGQAQKYKIKGKEYPAGAVEKAAAASGMTVDEYIKEANK